MQAWYKRKYFYIGLGAIVLVMVLWWLMPALCPLAQREGFGAAESLFTGLAFALLIVTAMMQKEELELQRGELQLTRVELKGQKEQLSIQAETARLQQFDSTFFSLLRLREDTLNSIVGMEERYVAQKQIAHEIRGRDCFVEFSSDCIFKIKHRLAKMKGISINVERDEAYEDFNRRHRDDLSYYFRTLYHIIRFVDNSQVANKRFYTNLIRASLSDGELTILFFNCLSRYGREDFKPLVEKYHLLKHLIIGNETIDQFRNEYAPQAFGSSHTST